MFILLQDWPLYPANIRLDEDVLKTSFVFRRRLEDVLIKTNMFALALCLQKTSSRRNGQDQDIRLGHTSSRRLQDVLQKRLQDIFKMFWRRLQEVLQGYLQDLFKTYHQVKLFLLTRLWEAFNTFLRRSFPKAIIYRGISPGNTTSAKFMVSVQNLQER